MSAECKDGYDHYPLSRDGKEEARLNSLHGIMTKCFDFLIHPSILPGLIQSSDKVRIADFGTGTAIWPIEVVAFFNKEVPDLKVKVSGFDISSALFPAFDVLPNGVHLHVHDVTKPMKEKYHVKFDLINVRALVLALGDDQWEGVVKELIKCLKPGGWIQWIDADMTPSGWKCVTHKVNNFGDLDPLRKLYSGQIPNPISWGIQVVNCWAKKTNRSLNSSGSLPTYFDANGLKDVQHDVMPVDGDIKLRTDFTVAIAESVGAIFERYASIIAEEEMSPQWTIDDANTCGQEMVRCAKEKIFWGRMDFNTVTGRKPVPNAVDAYIMEQVNVQIPNIIVAKPSTEANSEETSQHPIEVDCESIVRAHSVENPQQHEIDDGANPLKTTRQIINANGSDHTVTDLSANERVAGLPSLQEDMTSNIVEGPVEQAVHDTPIARPRKLLPHEVGTITECVQDEGPMKLLNKCEKPLTNKLPTQVKKLTPHELPAKIEKLLPHETVSAEGTTSQATHPLTRENLLKLSQFPALTLSPKAKTFIPHQLQPPHLNKVRTNERGAPPKHSAARASMLTDTNVKLNSKEIAKKAGTAALARIENTDKGESGRKRKLLPHEMGL